MTDLIASHIKLFSFLNLLLVFMLRHKLESRFTFDVFGSIITFKTIDVCIFYE